MISHSDISKQELMKKLKSKQISFAGNRRLKIYGSLKCASGKRMKMENRVFFTTQAQALEQDYRPCGHCIKSEYKKWIYLAN